MITHYGLLTWSKRLGRSRRRRQMWQLTDLEFTTIVEFIEELELLIEEDDGTFFTMPYLAKYQEFKEVCYAIADREE
jgi:hypothetical protein